MILLILILLISCYAYDENIAIIAVNLAQASYSVYSIDEWNCTTCNKNAKLEYIIENQGSKALQGYDKYTNTIFTSFRGSSNIHNWLENIRVKKIAPYVNASINVENGFYNAYNYIKSQLFDNLIKLQNKYKTSDLLITGHSLGAAMSTLMTYDILTIYTDYNIKYFINFGSPRVGNKDFVNSFNSYNINSYRITHYYDVVPHVPEEFIGYLHISNEIWYNELNNNYIICNDYNDVEDKYCSNSCSPLHCTSINDHLNYFNISMGTCNN